MFKKTVYVIFAVLGMVGALYSGAMLYLDLMGAVPDEGLFFIKLAVASFLATAFSQMLR